MIELARAEAGADTTVTWADGDWLGEQLGDDKYDAFPLWVPEEPGSHLFDPTAAIEAGLDNRPVAETVRDTLAWDRTREQAWPMEAGLSPEREAEAPRGLARPEVAKGCSPSMRSRVTTTVPGLPLSALLR